MKIRSIFFVSAAFASLPFPSGGVASAQFVQPVPGTTDADTLAATMRRVAANPQDVGALVTAGELSLKLDDVSGAASLFTRAEKVDPRNPRVKAGMASILVRSERPGEALRYFAQAESLGMPVRQIAADRALAYDLIGDQQRAQQDYRLALKATPEDDETIRRYALSLGIAGKREQALDELAPLLRRNDRGAWRARAFVLAMNGDLAGADHIATTMMPAGMAQGLRPFFERLPALTPVDRAFAVHFGEVRPTPERVADARLTPSLTPLAPEPGAARVAAVPRPAPAPLAAPSRDRVQLAAKSPAAPVPAPTRTPTPTTNTARVEPSQPRPGYAQPTIASQTAAVVPAPATAPRETVAASPVVPATTPRPTPLPAPATVLPTRAVTPERGSPPRATSVTSVESASVLRPVPERAAVASRPPAPVAPPVAAVSTPPAPTVPAPTAMAAAGPLPMPGFSTAPPTPAVEKVEPAAQSTRPPAPVRVSEDSILARIVAGLSIPAAELGVDAPERPRPAATVAAPVVDEAAEQRQRADREAAARAAEKLVRDKAAADKLAADRKAIADRKAADRKAIADKKALADRKVAAAEKALADRKAAEEKKAAKANPQRIWVQVAGGAFAGDLPKAWATAKAKAPKVLTGRDGWTTPLRATNRVLAGPFKTDAEARSFVNQLAKAGVSGFAFTSDEGQKVTRLSSK